jgi:hypothetical protein
VTVRRTAVLVDGCLRARLTYSGRAVLMTGTNGRRLGRLLPAGYTTGTWTPDSDAGLFEPWTAKHPHVHVPSDVITGDPMPLVKCVAFILGVAC